MKYKKIDHWCVYCHITPNNKKYIGITSLKPEHRWNHGRGYRTQKVFYRAIKKYGWDNIKHIILLDNLTYEQASRYEQYFITLFKTNCKRYHNPYFGYNSNDGGSAREPGFHLSEVAKSKLSNEPYHNNKKTPISYFDLDGNYLGTASTYNEAEKMTGQYKTNILKVVKGRVRQIGGYQFKYYDENDCYGIEKVRDRIANYYSKNNDPIYQYSLNGELIREYDNPRTAEKITGWSSANLIDCANGTYNTSHGYIWSFIKKEKIDPRIDKTKKEKRVNQLTADGNYITTFKSLAEASRFIGHKSCANILKVIKGERNQAGGYKWEYAS